MAEPTFDATTEDVWSRRVPGIYRVEDGPNGYALKRWISGIFGQLNTTEELKDRLDFTPLDEGGAPGESSDLTNPATADAVWLPWLAQFVGVRPENYATTSELRTAIASGASGFRPGTVDAIKELARSVLTGTQYVEVYDHSITTPGDGGEWDVLIVTVTSETTSDPATAVIAAGGKPAGVLLHHVSFNSTWDALEAGFANWNAIDAVDWQTIEEVGL